MRYVGLLAGIGLILAVTGTAGAVTLVFDPNDILDKYAPDSTGLKASQPDARRVHADWGNPYYGTFSDVLQAGHTQPSDYNTYVNWRNSLGSEGEGIACFNTWFLNNPLAASWGETVVTKPGTSVSATAAGGWNYTFITNPYNLGGTSVQWYTTDSTKRLRPTDLGGPDIGDFSITIDLYHDTGASGWDASDTPVLLGENVRFWLGGLNGDDAEFYRSDTKTLYFDNVGWPCPGQTPNYGTFAADLGGLAGDYGSGFEAAMEATAVPEPVTMAGLMLGIGALGGYVRRRRKP